MKKKQSQNFENSYLSGGRYALPAFNENNKVQKDYSDYMSQFNKKDYGMQTEEDKMREAYKNRPGYASGYSYDKYKGHIGAAKKRIDIMTMNNPNKKRRYY